MNDFSQKLYCNISFFTFIASLLRILEYQKFPQIRAVIVRNIANWFGTNQDDWSAWGRVYGAPWFWLPMQALFGGHLLNLALNELFEHAMLQQCALESSKSISVRWCQDDRQQVKLKLNKDLFRCHSSCMH